MASTGEAKPISTPNGPQFELTLHVDLIGFHRVPGRHTRDYLTQAFLFVLDHIKVTNKVIFCILHNS